jgi:hypothetical protein
MFQATHWIDDEKEVGYRNAPYIENKNGVYRCLLCKTGAMHRRNVARHMEGQFHQANLKHLRDAKQLLHRNNHCIAYILPRARKIRHDPWKHHVECLCFRYINSSSTGSPNQTDIEKIIRQYETREMLVVLELAVWKARLGDFSNKILLSLMFAVTHD